MAARLEREHQRAPAPVSAEGHRPVEAFSGRASRDPPQPQRPSPQDPRLHDTIRGLRTGPCGHRLNPPLRKDQFATGVAYQVGYEGVVHIQGLDHGHWLTVPELGRTNEVGQHERTDLDSHRTDCTARRFVYFFGPARDVGTVTLPPHSGKQLAAVDFAARRPRNRTMPIDRGSERRRVTAGGRRTTPSPHSPCARTARRPAGPPRWLRTVAGPREVPR